MMGMRRLFQHGSNLAAFLLPGVALWVPSGYSLGAALILLLSLASVSLWWRRSVPSSAWWLSLAVGGMAALWLMDVGSAWGWGSMDRPAKYLLALPCIFFLMAFPPRTLWLWMGVAVGAIGSGILGILQAGVWSVPRVTGFTNAIQYGNLSMLLAMMSGLLLIAQWRNWRWWQRVLFANAIVLGIAASVLSQARGGWLALMLLLPVGAWLLARTTGRRRAYVGLGALALAAAVLSQVPAVEQRVVEAKQEVQSYQQRGDSRTSVGQRLAHWGLAWQMGWDRPLTGWGRGGYEQEKARRVAAGQAPAIVLEFGHVHNEVLDLFAKRGLPGVGLLFIFYGIPLVLFWPSDRRIRNGGGGIDREALSLCLVGVSLPLSYASFGLTQVFLAHNSGNMFYLFMCPIVLAALEARRGQLSAAPAG